MNIRRKFLAAVLPISTVIATMGCDMYQSPPEATQEVVFIGDSHFDFNGIFPKAMADLAGQFYTDFSITGNYMDEVIHEQIPLLADLGTAKTVLVSAGANDILSSCSVRKSGANTTLENISDNCIIGLKTVLDKVEIILSELENIDSVNDIVWGGEAYNIETDWSRALIDLAIDGDAALGIVGVKKICEEFNAFDDSTDTVKCHFADLRWDTKGYYIWMPNEIKSRDDDDPEKVIYHRDYVITDADDPSQIFPDNAAEFITLIHFNAIGAERVAETLWLTMENAREGMIVR